MSGIRNRSQATRNASAGTRPHARPAPVVPADRHDRDPIPAPAGQVDQLDIEDDARDLLAREEVVRRRAREPLEPALRVLHRPDDPDRREQVEDLARGSAGSRAGWRACPSRRAGSASRATTSWSASAATSNGSWSGGVAMSASAKTIRSAVASSIPARTAAPLPPWATRSRRRVVPSGPMTGRLRPGLDDVGGRVRAAVVDDEDLDRPQGASPPRAHRRGQARRDGAGSRTARRAPGRSGRPRCTPAERSRGSRAVARLTSRAV